MSEMTKSKLLELMGTEYAAWQQLLAGIDEARLTEPGVVDNWSVKDIVAHTASWQKRSVERLRLAAEGKERPPTDFDKLKDDDEKNAFFYEQNRDLPLSQVLSDARATYQSLLAEVEKLSNADLTELHRFKWLGDYALWQLIEGNTYDHYQEHAASIRAWLER